MFQHIIRNLWFCYKVYSFTQEIMKTPGFPRKSGCFPTNLLLFPWLFPGRLPGPLGERVGERGMSGKEDFNSAKASAVGWVSGERLPPTEPPGFGFSECF